MSFVFWLQLCILTAASLLSPRPGIKWTVACGDGVQRWVCSGSPGLHGTACKQKFPRAFTPLCAWFQHSMRKGFHAPSHAADFAKAEREARKIGIPKGRYEVF
jgi:hypothetical protein